MSCPIASALSSASSLVLAGLIRSAPRADSTHHHFPPACRPIGTPVAAEPFDSPFFSAWKSSPFFLSAPFQSGPNTKDGVRKSGPRWCNERSPFSASFEPSLYPVKGSGLVWSDYGLVHCPPRRSFRIHSFTLFAVTANRWGFSSMPHVFFLLLAAACSIFEFLGLERQ